LKVLVIGEVTDVNHKDLSLQYCGHFACRRATVLLC
jgi:hypothetical protein